MALGQRFRGPREGGAARYGVASAGVMLGWLVLMVGAMISLITGKPAGLILPPLDRAVSAIVLVVVGWAFLTADQLSEPREQRLQPIQPIQRPQAQAGSRWLTVVFALL